MTKIEKKKLKKEKINAKVIENRKKGKLKKFNLFFNILFGMFLMISAYLIYNLYRLTGIETIIRYIVMFLLGFLDIFLLIKWFKAMRKPLISRYLVIFFCLLIFGAGEFFIAKTINKGLNVVENISIGKYRNYSSSLVAMSSGNLKTKKDITESTKIGRVNANKKDYEAYVLTKDIMKKDKISESQIVDYDDSISMLYDLYEGKIDAVFITSSYRETYKTMDKFENIESETIVLDSVKKKLKVQKEIDVVASTKSITEPFTILLMGVDSTEENLSDSSGLGDSLMVITYNPDTLNVTVFSIPRDTFVPITCYRNVNSKITHAASGGDKCMISTIENFLDINIDYYAKINFRGLMKLVDALGGIDVDVPYSLCETTMWRTETYMTYVKEGHQHLNGEQALGLSRNRKTYASCGPEWNKGVRNDFVRGQNQQLVVNAIINKARSMDNITQFYNVLEAVGSSMTTNMDRKQILSFYNVFKNILINSKDLTDSNDVINMQKLYLNGSGGLIKDGIMNMNLYEYVPSTESLNAIKKAMRVNLGLEDEEPSYSFSFSADEEYSQKVIGKDLYGGVEKYETMDDSSSSSTTCGTNEELGADNQTCVCKNGYERNKSTNTCEKKKITCPANEEPSKDNSICVCPTWNGFQNISGSCVCPSGNKIIGTQCVKEETITPIEPVQVDCWDGSKADSEDQCPAKPDTTTCPEGSNCD